MLLHANSHLWTKGCLFVVHTLTWFALLSCGISNSSHHNNTNLWTSYNSGNLHQSSVVWHRFRHCDMRLRLTFVLRSPIYSASNTYRVQNGDLSRRLQRRKVLYFQSRNLFQKRLEYRLRHVAMVAYVIQTMSYVVTGIIRRLPIATIHVYIYSIAKEMKWYSLDLCYFILKLYTPSFFSPFSKLIILQNFISQYIIVLKSFIKVYIKCLGLQ